jgi:membrane protein YqaA with SNARE-associated domain
LLTLLFFIQEPISTGAVLLEVYHLHYNLWIIHALFSLATLVDIAVGYYLGIFIRKRFGDRKMVSWLTTRFETFSNFIGKNGNIVALIVYAPLIFPIGGIFVPWLDITLTEALIFTFIGELIFWYIPEWLLVLGIRVLATDPFTALYLLIIVCTILILPLKYFSGRNKKPKSE